ncbi:MAG: UDP-N-acetylglucosamine 1-carboxyvinyltransferase [Clostridia bacterium]
MSKIVVNGGAKLKGELRVGGAKNAVLPILAGTLLSTGCVTLTDCPDILDAGNMMSILRTLGADTNKSFDVLDIRTKDASCFIMPSHLSKELRSSIFMLGPILSRFKRARCVYPGGCEIGNRPIDLHLSGLSMLNVKILEKHGSIICDGSDMRGNTIHLDYPSVGATENLMMAAVTAKGKTEVQNAAREPEIEDLQTFLNELGYSVHGAGTSTVIINGTDGISDKSVVHKIIPDRIVAGTFLTAAAITGGEINLKNCIPSHLSSIIAKLRETGCDIEVNDDSIRLSVNRELKEIRHLETLPHPGFPTDMQAPIFALCCVLNGTSIIVENVFENRFKHASELAKMGAEYTQKDRMAIIRGVKKLTGASLIAGDLRGGAALVLAGLVAEGETTIDNAELIDRGYERIDEQLRNIGANIRRID